MVSKSFELKVLTIEEMSRIKGAGPDPGYIGPAIESGEQDKRREQSFFNSLVSFFTFDFSTFFGTSD